MGNLSSKHRASAWLRALIAVAVASLPPQAPAQVTTATYYAIVSDSTGAVVPGATVTVTHGATGRTEIQKTDANGEVAFDFLPVGEYDIRIETPGFKRYEATGLELTAGRVVRQPLILEVGSVSETVNVEAVAPLVSTASSEQMQTFESLKVTELPLGRRNVTNVLRLATGVDISGHTRSIRINGVGKHGTGISVDGTDANANPEGRGMSQYQAQNYVDVMSIDAVQEVQLIRGIMPAEYGGVASGQVNLISKSGTNEFHGALFENFQNHNLKARNPFAVNHDSRGNLLPKQRSVFNQFGGTLGGPIVRNRLFFFGGYEGYREGTFRRISSTVPTEALKREMLARSPFTATRLLLESLPLPNQPIDDRIGTFVGADNFVATENQVLAKGDWRMTNSGNLAVTYTRSRPFSKEPRVNLGGLNDRDYVQAQDRLTANFILGRAAWTSETRFGYNYVDMDRIDRLFEVQDPDRNERILWGRRIPRFSIRGLFGCCGSEVWDMNGPTYSFDQKLARHSGRHLIKFGGRYMFYGGFRSNPENPSFSFDTLEEFYQNIPSTVQPTFGSPPYKSRMYEFGMFLQDDWRMSPKLVLNLGLRYDFYSNAVVEPTGEVPVGIVNLTAPSDWRKFDFGPALPFGKPYNHDPMNLAPRLGFAYNPDAAGKTVFRGGFGALFSSQMPGVVRQGAAHPTVPFRVTWSRAEAAQYGLRWPMYNEELMPVAERATASNPRAAVFSVLNPGLQNPYTMNFQFNIQRALAPDLMIETGYVGLRGVKFIMHRRYNQPDRITGIRPQPGFSPGGYYVDNSQRMTYDAWQTSLRKRYSAGLTFDVHYTWGKGLATAGGDVGAYYQGDAEYYIQDFDSYHLSRGPATGDALHRLLADAIYELPRLAGAPGAVRRVLGGWEVAGIFNLRSGEPAIVTQTCASDVHCRPDYAGGSIVLPNWDRNLVGSRCPAFGHCPLQYLNPAAFARVPLSPASRIAGRPGNVGTGLVRGPASWGVDTSLARNFNLRESLRLQFRADWFNAINRVNYGGPSTGADSPTFGQIGGAGGMRTVQLNARLTF